MVDYQKIEELVREAGMMLKNACLANGQAHVKEGMANFCTDYDIAIQEFLIAKIGLVMPEAGFFGEEETDDSRSVNREYVFYIDPIDGTTNFMFGYHHSCVSVGLAQNNQIIAGWVFNPYSDEMYTAIRGVGSFLNGERLKMKDIPIEEGIVAFGCARYNDADINVLFDAVKDVFLRSLSIRNGGSAAIDLCRVASGNNAAYFELKLQPYDYAAASVIVEEAGGVISQVSGDCITLNAPCSVVCGTPKAWNEIDTLLLERMK